MNREEIMNEFVSIFDATDQVLSEHKWDKNLPIPTLLASVAAKMNWDDKTTRLNEGAIKVYLRKHDDWYLTRGAKGGVQPAETRKKKEELKAAKIAFKIKLKEAIEQEIELKKNQAQATVWEGEEDENV